MFELNGIVLDNDAKGWHLQHGSEPWTGVKRRVTSLSIPGRDGEVDVGPGDIVPAFVPLKLRMPRAALREFLALVSAARTLAPVGAAWEAGVKLEMADVTNLPTASPRAQVDVLLRIPSGKWRDKAESTSTAVNVSAASVAVGVFSGLSAPVGDSIVRVKGNATGLRVTDSGGSWFEYLPNIPTTSYLRFHSDSGRAFVTTSDVWTGGTDVSGVVDFNGPRGRFEITPSFSDPATRQGALTVTTSARSGSQIQVRGKGAYLV